MHNPTEDYIRTLLANNLESQMSIADDLPTMIDSGAQKIVHCLLQDGKLLVCGIGASAANALHFSTALIHEYTVERPALPAIVLAQDLTFNDDNAQIFARQIQALGTEKDLLLILTTTGDSNSLINAVHAAKEREMDILVLSGRNGGILSNHLGPEDLEIRVSLHHPARIREMHLFILHCFCDLIDQALFGATS
ncbi:MAG: SIS domain-containing protein [Gammaproteobacteria bacterium]|nr:SIS domain-containing protein [Gammaproteobacteria bacterium]